MAQTIPSLSRLGSLARITTSNIRDNPGAKRTAKMLGRGPGSGKGRTAGRGMHGQNKRGHGKGAGFEGGQTPLQRRLPKHGCKGTGERSWNEVNLGQLQCWIDQGRLNPGDVITQRAMWESGLTGRHLNDGVKLLAGGAENLAGPINIEVARATKSAIDAIELKGGHVLCVFRSKLAMRAHLRPDKFLVAPRAGPPVKPKELLYYKDWANRGYLAPEAATGAE